MDFEYQVITFNKKKNLLIRNKSNTELPSKKNETNIQIKVIQWLKVSKLTWSNLLISLKSSFVSFIICLFFLNKKLKLANNNLN